MFLNVLTLAFAAFESEISFNLICDKHIDDLVELGEEDSEADDGSDQTEEADHSQASLSLGLGRSMTMTTTRTTTMTTSI